MSEKKEETFKEFCEDAKKFYGEMSPNFWLGADAMLDFVWTKLFMQRRKK